MCPIADSVSLLQRRRATDGVKSSTSGWHAADLDAPSSEPFRTTFAAASDLASEWRVVRDPGRQRALRTPARHDFEPHLDDVACATRSSANWLGLTAVITKDA